MKEKLRQSTFFVTGKNPPPVLSEQRKYLWIIGFSLLLITIGGLIETPSNLVWGLWQILVSSSVLVTDYFEIANTGSAFLNSGLVTLSSTLLAKRLNVKLSGPVTAALYTMCGFSFFGKNMLNSLPIMLGVLIFASLHKKKFSTYILVAFFGTALSPAVSLVAFGLGLNIWVGLALGLAVGLLIGLLLPALAVHFLSFHQGFSLYNIGFTAGIIGMFLTATMRLAGFEVINVSLLSTGNNLLLSVFLYSSFGILFLIGFFANNRSLNGYRGLIKSSGKLVTDFIALDGYGITLINMASLGVFATSYVLVVGGELNGAVIGGIFTLVGFGAFGCHLRNSLPIFVGVYVASFLTGTEINSTSALLAALFGTTLAPIAGYYGVIPGILAGSLHMALVSNVGFLHGGINLYNNGFSGGFTAAFLVPIFDSVKDMFEERAQTKS